MRLQLFGPPTVTWDGTPLPVSRRQVRALLYRLATHREPVPRELLCFLFWPDTPESAARRKLTNLLSHLKGVLPVPELLLTEEDRVWLDAAYTWSDTAAFERGLARASTLGKAITLYRGPFLEGFSLPDAAEFELWASLERQAWQRRYLDALAALVERHAARQDLDAAIECALRYLAVDELAEDIHRRLIELYAAAGDRGCALRHFETCVAVLERELGVPPLPETQAVYQAVLESRPLPQPGPRSVPRWTTLPCLDAPLIGRGAALRKLDAAYGRARSGHGGLLLLSGEPGIGKSRLIQEFASRVQGEALVLAGTGYPDTQTTPYQLLVEALRPALQAGHPWLQLPSHSVADASHVLPELRALYPGSDTPLSGRDEQMRSRLFDALCVLTLALAAGPYPLLLCLDDLHWADSTTLDWLAHLGRRVGGARLLVIGAYRSEEAGTLAALRHSLARQGRLTEVELSGLDAPSVLQVIQSLRGGTSLPQDGAVATRLANVTGGNPLFLLETLRALLESGQPLDGLSPLDKLQLTDTVREVVETRVTRLSSTARQVLEAAAVLGQTFAFDLVHRTSGRREMETMNALDELVARQLLWEQVAGYGFCHELIQLAVYQALSYWRRRVLHRRAAEVLEKLQPTNAAALARHFARAEEPGRAASYALQAGRSAKAVFAHVEARRLFDQALALLQGQAAHLQEPDALAANRSLRVEALHERGWALRLLGDMEAYARDLQEVSRLAELLQDEHTLAHLHWRQAYTHRWFCRYTQARAAAQEGLSLSQHHGDRLLEAQCWREIGMAARETGDYDGAQAALAQSLAIFADLGEPVYQIHALGNLATLHWYRGDYARTMSLSQQALQICEAAQLPLQRRLPLGDMGAAAAALGDTERAQSCLQESLSIARQIADRTQEILCLLHLGWLSIRQQRPAAALPHLQAGLDLARRIGSCTEQGGLLCGLAEAHRLTGEHQAAQAHAQQALTMAQATHRPYDERLARRILDRLEKR